MRSSKEAHALLFGHLWKLVKVGERKTRPEIKQKHVMSCCDNFTTLTVWKSVEYWRNDTYTAKRAFVSLIFHSMSLRGERLFAACACSIAIKRFVQREKYSWYRNKYRKLSFPRRTALTIVGGVAMFYSLLVAITIVNRTQHKFVSTTKATAHFYTPICQHF